MRKKDLVIADGETCTVTRQGANRFLGVPVAVAGRESDYNCGSDDAEYYDSLNT